MASNVAVPLFSILFDIDSGEFTFTDLVTTGYHTLYGLVQANLKGIIKITGPDGMHPYVNAGWDDVNPVFTDPDILGSAPTWSKGGINIPEDSHGEVVKGLYKFEYWLTNGTNKYYAVHSYDYQFDIPIVTISEEVICHTALLVSEDTTDYNSDGFVPAIVEYGHTITQPSDGVMNPVPGTTTDKKRIIGGGSIPTTALQSGIYQIDISNEVNYDLDTWNSYPWIIVHVTVTGHNNATAECEDCACEMNTCMVQLNNSYKEALENDPKRASELRELIFQIHTLYLLFEGAERCSEDYSEFCNSIRQLLQKYNCECQFGTDESSHPIYPYGGSSATVYIVDDAWSSGTAAPGSSTPGKLYMQKVYDSATPPKLTHLYYWEKVSGTWTMIGDVVGQGYTGPSAPIKTGPPGHTGHTGPLKTGPTGPGHTGARGSVIWPVVATPSNSVGLDGDWAFLTVLPFQIWYKTGGAWVSKISGLGGKTGDTGPIKTGPPGATGIGISITGHTGPIKTGPTGPVRTGPTGQASTVPGPTGPSGAAAVTKSTVSPVSGDIPPCIGAQWINTVTKQYYIAINTNDGTDYRLIGVLSV
jgi:hypothetical protein